MLAPVEVGLGFLDGGLGGDELCARLTDVRIASPDLRRERTAGGGRLNIFAPRLEVSGFRLLKCKATVAVVETKQDVALAHILGVDDRHVGDCGSNERSHLRRVGANIGIVGGDMAAVVQHVPASAGEEDAGSKTENHFLAPRVGGLSNGRRFFPSRFDRAAFAAQHLLGITFSHVHFSERAIGPAKPPPRARTSWTSRVKARVSSCARARRALTTLSSAVSTVR